MDAKQLVVRGSDSVRRPDGEWLPPPSFLESTANYTRQSQPLGEHPLLRPRHVEKLFHSSVISFAT